MLDVGDEEAIEGGEEATEGGEEATEGGEDATEDGEEDAVASTKCIMNGLPNAWPHPEAEPNDSGLRRLLHSWNKKKVMFTMTAEAVGVPSWKKHGQEATCMDDGTVTMDLVESVVT